MSALEMGTAELLAIAAALGWASGLRLYAVLFLTGAAGFLGWVELPRGLQLLQHPAMLGASGLMFAVEFFADKIPGVDSVSDVLQTLVRIPAGAVLAGSVFGADHATMAAVAALLGGTLAATSHVSKATTRAAANTSPEPLSNLGLSLAGDAAVPAMLWLAWTQPAVFAVVLVLALGVMVTLTWMFAKFLRALVQRVLGWFGREAPSV